MGCDGGVVEAPEGLPSRLPCFFRVMGNIDLALTARRHVRQWEQEALARELWRGQKEAEAEEAEAALARKRERRMRKRQQQQQKKEEGSQVGGRWLAGRDFGDDAVSCCDGSSVLTMAHSACCNV